MRFSYVGSEAFKLYLLLSLKGAETENIALLSVKNYLKKALLDNG